MAFYVVHPGGQRDGPLNLDALQSLVTAGQLAAGDYVIEVQGGARKMAGEVAGLDFPGDKNGTAKHWYPCQEPLKLSGGPTSNYSASYGVGIVALCASCFGWIGLVLALFCSVAAIGLASNVRYSRPEQVKGPMWFSRCVLGLVLALILLRWLNVFAFEVVQ